MKPYWLILTASLVLWGLSGCGARQLSEHFSPETDQWAGEYELVEFPNGFRLIAHRRDHYPGVYVRLDVAVGSANFKCSEKEIPHAIEHIVSDSYRDLSPSEFESLKSGAAFTGNAETSRHITSYYYEVPPGALNLVLEHLEFGLLEANFSASLLEKTKKALNQEKRASGEPRPHFDGDLRDWSVTHHFFAEVAGPLMKYCGDSMRIDSLILSELRSAFSRYYQPQNMSMSVVGMFEPEYVVEWAKTSIGKTTNAALCSI